MKSQRTKSQERIVELLQKLNCSISAQNLYMELLWRLL
jgi:Fe2+ or Zn2+ uptake regulation protein